MKILWKTNSGGACAHALRAGKYESLCGAAAGRPTLWTRPRPGTTRCSECLSLTANSVKQPVPEPRAGHLTALRVMTLADVQGRLGCTITENALAAGWLRACCIINSGGEARGPGHRLYAVRDVEAVRNRIRNGQFEHPEATPKPSRTSLHTAFLPETAETRRDFPTAAGALNHRKMSEKALNADQKAVFSNLSHLLNPAQTR